MLVDDQALVRSGFRIILETEPDIEVVAEAANGAEAVALAAALAPDVICMDVEMPEMNGLEASRQILGGIGAAAGAAPAVLVLTTFGHEEYLFEALAAGVSGFLLKTARAEQLIDAVRTLAGGGALLGTDVTRAVMLRAAGAEAGAASAAGATTGAAAPTLAGAAGADPAAAPAKRPEKCAALEAAGLTGRETQVLRQLATGASNAEIASALFVGESTVKTHVSNILQKLGARDRIQAVVWAHTNGVR